MFRLWHKLFGWDYVLWYCDFNYVSGISRVQIGFNGEVYYRTYGTLRIVKTENQVIWLTCHPSKYVEAKK